MDTAGLTWIVPPGLHFAPGLDTVSIDLLKNSGIGTEARKDTRGEGQKKDNTLGHMPREEMGLMLEDNHIYMDRSRNNP